MIHFMKGDIFTSECEWLVNPINCVGVMGAGLAKEFKQRYPQMFEAYKYECSSNSIQVGDFFGWLNPDLSGKNVALVPTKNHWREKSKITNVDAALSTFCRMRESASWQATIKSIAFPKLGCGLGGLNWQDVKPVMEQHLEPISDEVMVEIWE